MEIHELNEPEGRIILFRIPADPKGFPIAFDGNTQKTKLLIKVIIST